MAPEADIDSNCSKLCLKYWVSCISFHVVSRLRKSINKYINKWIQNRRQTSEKKKKEKRKTSNIVWIHHSFQSPASSYETTSKDKTSHLALTAMSSQQEVALRCTEIHSKVLSASLIVHHQHWLTYTSN